jgi:hypothetical protein
LAGCLYNQGLDASCYDSNAGIGLEYLAERVRPLWGSDRVIIKKREHRMCACTQSVIAGEIETRYGLAQIAHLWKALSHHPGGGVIHRSIVDHQDFSGSPRLGA